MEPSQLAKRRRLGASRAGQVSVLDLIVAMMLFISIMFIAFSTWAEANITVFQFDNVNSMKNRATDALDILLKTRGSPSNWEDLNLSQANVSSIGLVSENSVLDSSKLEKLLEMPYDESRRLMGFGAEGYYITIKNSHGSKVYSAGEDLAPEISLERLALLDGDPVTFTLNVFQR